MKKHRLCGTSKSGHMKLKTRCVKRKTGGDVGHMKLNTRHMKRKTGSDVKAAKFRTGRQSRPLKW